MSLALLVAMGPGKEGTNRFGHRPCDKVSLELAIVPDRILLRNSCLRQVLPQF